MQDRFESTKPGTRFYLALLAIVCIGVVLRVYQFHHTIGSDDQRWILAARHLGQEHDPGILPIYYARVGFRVALAVWGWPWGLTLSTSAPLMFLLSAYCTCIVAVLGRMLISPLGGLLAAGLYTTHPLTVVYDVVTLPDNLAQAILVTAVLFLLLHIRGRSYFLLAAAGVLIGSLYSIKDYYVLAAMPSAMAALWAAPGNAVRWRRGVVIVVAVAIGVSADLLVNFWESGNPLYHVQALGSYPERIVDPAPGQDGWKRVGALLAGRWEFVRLLIFDLGPIGFVTVLGAAYLFALCRRATAQGLALTGLAFIFLLFLVATPVSLRPLRLVELQARYLLVLIPFLSIGSAGALAEVVTHSRSLFLRAGVFFAVLVCGASSLAVASDLEQSVLFRYNTLQMLGIERVLMDAKRSGIRELVLPRRYGQLVPDRFYRHGVDLTFLEVVSPGDARDAASYVEGRAGCAVLILRAGFTWDLEPRLRRGDYSEKDERPGAYEELGRLLDTSGFVQDKVSVPSSIALSWAARLGVSGGRRQLVGWVYRRPHTSATPP